MRLLLAALLALSIAAGCGGQDAATSSRLTPADVQRYVAVKEATDNMTRLIELIGTADGTVDQLSRQRAGSASARSLMDGAKIGWNNVMVGLNAFTPSQAKEVSGLAGMVLAYRELAITWSNTLDHLAVTTTSGGGCSTARPRPWPRSPAPSRDGTRSWPPAVPRVSPAAPPSSLAGRAGRRPRSSESGWTEH
jgi:hypothetical protein